MADQLFPYQVDGALWLSQRNRALLADGMGLGKTPQALVAAAALDAKRVAVICPAIARVNWRREAVKWAPRVEILAESYDKASRPEFKARLEKFAPDILILDEAHYLKTRDSKRTRAIYGPWCNGKGLAAMPPKVWLLTGTPTPNNVGELFPHLRALWPELLPEPGNFNGFIGRYCVTEVGDFGLKILGNKNVPELRERLAGVMLRRRAEDVLKDLPPIAWSGVVVEADAINPELRAIEASPEVKALRAVLEDPAAELEDGAAVHLATLRRLTGTAKADVVAMLLHNELNEKAYDKVVVFAQHRQVVADIEAHLASFGAVSITGSTSDAQRNANIDRFQTDPTCRVFVGQIQACATAVTLHAASQVVFAEASWVPADNAQAAKRCHRIGQTRPVLVRMIGLAGSVDEAVTKVLRRKAQQISQLID